MPDHQEHTGPQGNGWEPTIVAFFCNWCTYTAADLAGTSRLKYPPNARVIRVMCSGRVGPQVLRGGVVPRAGGGGGGGSEDGGGRVEWRPAGGGERVARFIREMTESLRALGPLDLPGMRRRWDTELTPHPAAEAPIHQLAAEGR